MGRYSQSATMVAAEEIEQLIAGGASDDGL